MYCNKPCGGGVTDRKRSCTNPTPMYGGRNCTGLSYEFNECNTHQCSRKQCGFCPTICLRSCLHETGWPSTGLICVTKFFIFEEKLFRITQIQVASKYTVAIFQNWI